MTLFVHDGSVIEYQSLTNHPFFLGLVMGWVKMV
jgi:hypothetical protein